MSAPIDQSVRTQAATAVGQSCTLAAGAGAGKTSVLVDRLVHHLLDGVPADQIAAITFTRAAANELRSRSRDAIEQRLREATSANQTEDMARLSDILSSFGRLTLSTIHAFCKTLLETEALDAQWAPDTEVASTIGAAALEAIYDAWRLGFDERNPDLILPLRLRTHETSFRESPSIRKLAQTLVDNRDLEPVTATPGPVDWAAALQGLREVLDRLEQTTARCKNPATCTLIRAGQPYIDQLKQLCQPDDEPESIVLAALELAVPSVTRKGAAKNWAPADKAAAQQAFEDAQDWQSACQQMIGAQIHAALVADMQKHYLPVVKEARLEAAQADFSDLLFRSRRLLIDCDAARQRLATRFKAILIDEVQDTDPIQAEVATLLARAPDQEGPWQQSEPRPGSLFVVGDPRQSIYRFRRADVQVWDQLQSLVAQNGTGLTLIQNFRSVPGIVAWVNHVFASLPGFVAQQPYRPPAALSPVVTLQADSVDEEIDALITHLAHLRHSKAMVFDKALGSLRPIRDSDILILLPSWTKALVIQEKMVLAGFECTVDGGEGFFKRDEVRLSMAALRAIEEPGDSESIVRVLRGLFGVSFADLAAHRLAGGSWSYLHPSPPPGPVSDALKELRLLHYERHRQSWVELLDGLLDATAATAVWALTTRRWSILANLDKLRALIRTIEPNTRSSSEVIEALERLKDGTVTDLSLVDDDTSAARVMSYFKAKGLEAPVVAIVCASRQKGTITHTVQRTPDGDWIAASAGDKVAPPDWPTLKEAEQTAMGEERRRWMYVAATRARDQLILVNSPKGGGLYTPDIQAGMGKLDTAMHGVPQVLGPGVSVTHVDVGSLPAVAYDRSTFPGLDERVDVLLQEDSPVGDPEGEARQKQLLQNLATSRGKSTRWRSVGNLNRRRVISIEGGGVGTRGGTLVHQVMEHLDLAQPQAALEAQVPGLVQAFGVLADIDGEWLQRCQDVVLRLLELPVIEQARQAAERWREVDFAHPVRGLIVAGRIDLCFPVTPDRTRWVVVDWKSHLPPQDSPLHEVYRKQLSAYALALLATVTPCQHVDTVLAGPHQEMGDADVIGMKQTLVHEYLVDLLMETYDAGHEAEIGLELEGDTYVMLEMAWEDLQIGLGLDLSDQEVQHAARQGWTIVRVDTTRPAWPSVAREAILPLLGMDDPEREEDEDGRA